METRIEEDIVECEENGRGDGEELRQDIRKEVEQMLGEMRKMKDEIYEEMRELREEWRRNREEMRREMKEERKKGEQEVKEVRRLMTKEMMELREMVKNEIGSRKKKAQGVENEPREDVGRRDAGDSQGNWDQLVKEVDMNKKYMGLMFEELDKSHERYNLMEAARQEEAEQMKNVVYDRVQEKLSGELERMYNNIQSLERASNIDGRHTDNGMRNKESEAKEQMYVIREPHVGSEAELPRFSNKVNENPRRFLEDFEEFVRTRRIEESGKIYWLKKCLADSVKTWFEAVGRGIKDFDEVKRVFLERYWGNEQQEEVIRRLYTPGTFTNQVMSREQYVLAVCTDNQYLDSPMSERSLITALSRQFGTRIARHIMSSNVTKITEFAKWLNDWERVEKDQASEEKNEERGSRNVPQVNQYPTWIGSRGRDGNYERQGNGRPWNRRPDEPRRGEEEGRGKPGDRGAEGSFGGRNHPWKKPDGERVDKPVSN